MTEIRFNQLCRLVVRWLPVCLAVAIAVSPAPGFAADATTEAGSLPTANNYPLATSPQAETTPKTGQIFQLKPGPINDRKPLLMIHGGEGENKPLFRWDKLVDRFIAEPGFESTYKMYLFRYDSKVPLDQTVPELRQILKQLYSQTGKPACILALSMGGNIIQQAMSDPEVDKVVEVVLTMGTPFHGSPLFSQNWFQYSLNKSWVIPFAQAVHTVDYKFYFGRHKNYLEDLKWDNMDNLIPNVGKFKALVPFGPRGELTPATDSNPDLKELNTAGHIDKRKFITYAGYIYNPYLMPVWQRRIENSILAPYYYVTVRLPFQIGKTRPALKMLNGEMSRMLVAGMPPRLTSVSHAYKLNDGITPVNSALFLPPEAINKFKEIGESDFSALKAATDVGTARVFRDVDHVAFLDGGPGGGKAKLVRDELHPQEGKRHILDWVVYDLMKYKSSAQVANQSAPVLSGKSN